MYSMSLTLVRFGLYLTVRVLVTALPRTSRVSPVHIIHDASASLWGETFIYVDALLLWRGRTLSNWGIQVLAKQAHEKQHLKKFQVPIPYRVPS